MSWTCPGNQYLHSNRKQNCSIISQEDDMWEQHTANTCNKICNPEKNKRKNKSNFISFLLTFWNPEKRELTSCDVHKTHERKVPKMPEIKKVCFENQHF